MRILFWSETFWPHVGGVENLAARLLPALRSRGHEFIVITWENTKSLDEIRYQGIPVYRFPFFAGGRQGSVEGIIETRVQVAKLKRRFASDLVHINSYGRSGLFHLMTANAHVAPTLVTLHQGLPDKPVEHESLLGQLLHSAAWVTACSASVLTHTQQLVPQITRRSSVIYNALPEPSFNPPPMSFDPPRILCLGRTVFDKGFDLALAAFEAVLHRFPNARLTIGGDGAEREKLIRQAAELGVGDAVEFLGAVPVDDVPQRISQATLVLMPSRLEGFGLVALEAALIGRPVVATRVGGLPEVVAHEETGLLVGPQNSRALSDALVFLLTRPDVARRMGESARARARRLFGWERYVNAYAALYGKVTEGRRETVTHW